MQEVKLLIFCEARQDPQFFRHRDSAGQEHPTSRLLESLSAGFDELIDTVGPEKVSYFRGYVRGHGQSCEPCKVAASGDGATIGTDFHPTQDLIEAAYADDNRLSEQFGPLRAAYLQGYTEGHIEGCEPCHVLVDREQLKYL